MAESAKSLKHGEITEEILNVFYQRVYAESGYGFLESVYEKAMTQGLEQRSLQVVRQQKIVVSDRGVEVGEYLADLVVNDNVIVVLKASAQLTPRYEA